MVTTSGICSKIKADLFTYETPKMVLIESRFIGVMHRMMQFLLFIVVIGWIFVVNKGYQVIDNGAIGVFTTKLKGVAFSNSTDVRVGKRIWDSADLHVPPQDSGSFFVTTNIIVTDNQVQGVCPDLGEWSTECADDSDCLVQGEPFHQAHGVSTGVCNKTVGYCMVQAWCDTEDDSLPDNGTTAGLQRIKDFTVFIKNNVYFPLFDKGRSNLIESVTKAQIHSGCNYHPVDDPYCPIFRIGTIVGMADRKADLPDQEVDDEIFKEMAIEGGVISITVKWDCNFDYGAHRCKPQYGFERLDNLQSNAVSPGYNFRYPLYYVEDGIQKRQLIKAFGILFALNTEATARRFDTAICMLNIGSGLALLGIAAIISDILLLKIHRNRQYFKKYKTDPKVTIAQRKSEAVAPKETPSTSTSSQNSYEMEEKNTTEPPAHNGYYA